MARLQRTVFVDRTRRQQTGDAIAAMVRRLAEGIPVVLFAEGTSNDGNRVLPFRSALIGALRDAAAHDALQGRVAIQPLSIGYVAAGGIPLGRRGRTLTAWYGDLDLLPHLKRFIYGGPFDVTVTFGDPLADAAGDDRKAVAKTLESSVRRMTAAALRGGIESATIAPAAVKLEAE